MMPWDNHQQDQNTEHSLAQAEKLKNDLDDDRDAGEMKKLSKQYKILACQEFLCVSTMFKQTILLRILLLNKCINR